MTNTTYTNINSIERATRIVTGLALIYSITLPGGTLGITAILPLVAVYPIMTGIMGWDPVYSMIAQLKNRMARTGATPTGIARA